MNFRSTVFLASFLVLLVLLFSGCAHYPVNAPLEHHDPAGGYRFSNLSNKTNSDSLLMTLAFSGGGTRAAALSYGVLEELARTEIPLNGGRKRMLDEVDSLSAVSGGSFTAAYYALFGDRIFTDFESKFLERDVQKGLFLKFFAPWNVARLMSPWLSRSDLAAEYYDKKIFGGATYQKLIEHGQRPYLMISATDMARGTRLEFTQDQFDLLGSDISSFHVARAVAASSAIAIFMSPITLKNYEPPPNFTAPPWISAGLSNTNTSRRRLMANDAHSYLNVKDYPYVHLMDGGSADNLGLRGPLNGVIAMGGAVNTIRQFKLEQVRRVVLIVVNATTGGNPQWSRDEKPPGITDVILAAGGVPMENYSMETLELFRQSIEKWSHELQLQRANGNANAPAVIQFYPIVVSFDSLRHESERRYFESVPTNFHLSPATVTRLREVAAKLLRESETFQMLLRDLEQANIADENVRRP